MRCAHAALVVLLACTVPQGPARSDVVLKEDFEQQGNWRKQLRGKGSAELVPGGARGKCLKITTAQAGMAYYSVDLDLAKVRGKKLEIRAKVKLDNVVVGAQPWCRAKIHVGTWVGKKLLHRPKLFDGTMDWHDQVLIAPVPENAERVVLDLGIQMGTGTAYYDELVVDDGLKPQMALDLSALANTSYSDGVAGDGRGGFVDTGSVDLRDIPTGQVRLGGIDFYVMPPGENYGATCVALRGLKRPQLPDQPKGAVAVGRKGRRLLFLHAAAWVDPARQAPCLTYTVRFADGQTVDIPIREGVDIAAFDAPGDLPNWKVVWRSERAGRTIGLGLTEWRNPRPDAAIECIMLKTSGKGAVPIIVAITLDRKG